MPTTTNRAFSVPTTGSQSGVWGSADLNPNFTAIDNALGAVSSVALSSSNVTLSSGQYACGTIKFTGTLSANVTITWPSVSGWWTVINATTGNFYIRLSCSVGGLKICPPPGQTIDVCFDATDAYYRSLPHMVGSYWDFCGSSVPVWVSGCSVPPYLLCDGSSFSAVTYPYLNGLLGGTTLPDHRGRTRIALDGGTSRVTTAVSGIDGATVRAAGGAQSVTLDATMIPSHTHSATSTSVVTDPGHTHNAGNNVNSAVSGGPDGFLQTSPDTAATSSATTGITVATTTTNANTGGGLAHNNCQPTVVGGITMIRAA